MILDQDRTIAALEDEVAALRAEVARQNGAVAAAQSQASAQLARAREHVALLKAAAAGERLRHEAELKALRDRIADNGSGLLPPALRSRLDRWRRDRKLKSDMRAIRRSGLFDAAWYSARYGDVGRSGIDPLYHYVRHGASEGRDPNPDFDSAWYSRRYPDAREAGGNPLLHYIRTGAAEGHDPSPMFRTSWYVSRYADVKESGLNPLLHFQRFGRPQGRSPVPLAEKA
jgi:hypothetical protein